MAASTAAHFAHSAWPRRWSAASDHTKESMGMRALITGGAGFIGSHLAERLLEEGHEVAILDDLSSGRLENIEHLVAHPSFSVTIGSVLDEAVLGPLVDECDTVFHLAAALGVKFVVDRPIHTMHTNVHGTEAVLRHASRGRKNTLVVSTSEVYGKSDVLPFREDADLVMGPPNKTRWNYATSKLLDEFLALGYWKEEQLPVRVVRLFNTVGPRQNSQYGMVLPNFVRRALAGEPIVVHGDGAQTRSFTWVGDVVSALIGLVNDPRTCGEVFNVGNGAEISIRDLAVKVKEKTGSDSPIAFVPYNQVFDDGFEDMRRRVPDISKIAKFIGYRPTVHLDEIIDQVVDYWAETAQRTTAARNDVDADNQQLLAMVV
jgi:nucleoside-diphosphate-sugar epimerase